MSHIQSHHLGTDKSHDTFAVILKVHGESLHLWRHDIMLEVGKTHSFRISCHNVDTHPDHPGSDIRVLTLTEPAPEINGQCSFKGQHPHGQPIAHSDLVIFMTGPMASSRMASYAIDLGLARDTTAEHGLGASGGGGGDCDGGGGGGSEEVYTKIGTTFLYLDPSFSSQGIQKTPIISTSNQMPIGQIQIEYLIVTNPVAYDVPAPKPDWLSPMNQMVAGHRGAGSGRRMDLPDELLENTIASFNYARSHGADMCELDVLVSADGVPIVYHDFDVDAVAAQQSSDQLGKLRVQVNEFTVKQLRDFRLLALHDGEGCPYTLHVPNQKESNRPFPTLEEVFDQVDETCGFNLEVKWPQMLESGKMEARRYREINDFVDRIIRVVEKHARNRKVILESFDADLVIMLRLKQTRFPVIFLSQGMTDRYERYTDIRARSVRNGIYFAQAFDLAGIDLIMEYYFMFGKKLVDFIHDHDLVARAWGEIDREKLRFLMDIGVQCVTFDKIDLIDH